MRTFLRTVVGGALGLLALYVVGKVSYQIGHEMAEVEHHYDEVPKEPDKKEEDDISEVVESDVPAKKPNKIGMIAGLKKIFHNKPSILSDIIRHPDEQRLEAFIDGNRLCIFINRDGH